MAQGKQLLDATIRLWFELVAARWPSCFQEIPNVRDSIVLDGCRLTKYGLKVSYHVIFPGLTFERNDACCRKSSRS